jgi:hypothetical protein
MSTTMTALMSPLTIGTSTEKLGCKKTYTTAGTVYNPAANQPINPPNRRGRTIKWIAGGTAPAGEVSFLPSSFLASLALSDQFSTVRSSPVTAVAKPLPQYAPLQQNYDRAVSPVHELEDSSTVGVSVLSSMSDHSHKKMSATPASTISGGPQEMVADLGIYAESSKFDDSSDNDLTEDDALYALTVKSLANIASFPNPNQKKAQKALQRARLATVSPVTTIPTNAGSVDQPRVSRTSSTDIEPLASTSSRSTSTDQAAVNSSVIQDDFYSHGDPQSSLNPPAATLGGQQAYAGYGRMLTSSTRGGFTTLATGPGAPRPLTAGPPGQRQYRASTFESTLKALGASPNGIQQHHIRAERRRHKYLRAIRSTWAPHELQQHAIRELDDSVPDIGVSPSSSHVSPIGTPEKKSGNCHDQVPGQLPNCTYQVQRVSMHDTLSFEEAGEYYPKGFPLNFKSKSKSIPQDWRETYPVHGSPRREPGTGRLTEEELQYRNDKINRQFYSGVEKFYIPMDETILKVEQRQFQRFVGPIGTRNTDLDKVSQMQMKDDLTTPTPRVDDDHNMLVNLAFSTLLCHCEADLEGGFGKEFGVVPPQLVDDSKEGRQSCFGNTISGAY